jgi:hypothetical protein
MMNDKWRGWLRRYRTELIFVGLVLGIGGCAVGGAAWLFGWHTPPNLSNIAEKTGVSFPVGTRLLHVDDNSDFFGAETLWAKIELPPDSTQNFLASLPPRRESSAPDARGRFSMPRAVGLGWWDPQSSKQFVEATSVRGVSVLIASDQGPRPVVYLYYSED